MRTRVLFFCVVVVLLCCAQWAKRLVWHKFGGRGGIKAARECRKRAYLIEGMWVCVRGCVYV